MRKKPCHACHVVTLRWGKKNSPVRKILFANWGTKIRQFPLLEISSNKRFTFLLPREENIKKKTFPLPFSPPGTGVYGWIFILLHNKIDLPILGGLLYLSAFLYVDNILVAVFIDILQELFLAYIVVH